MENLQRKTSVLKVANDIVVGLHTVSYAPASFRLDRFKNAVQTREEETIRLVNRIVQHSRQHR